MTTTMPAKEEKAKETAKQSTAISRREHPFLALQEEMNRLFEDFKVGFPFGKTTLFEPMADFNAKVDMKDDDKAITVTADLPGVEMKDIEVKVEDGSLVIKGEKRSEKEEKDKNYYRMERNYGSFYRLLPLPVAVEKNKVEAVYKDGVLKVTLPKSKEIVENGRKVEVKAG